MAEKKSASKKKTTTTKTKTKTKTVHKVLKNAKPENYFILGNGQPIKGVLELADMLEDMRGDLFYYHVTEDRNDFAAWIAHVFEDEKLAQEIGGLKDPLQTRIMIYRHLAVHATRK